MKQGFAQGFAFWVFALFAAFANLGSEGAVLTWNPNPPEENIAFYTVYIDSPEGTSAEVIEGESRFDLSGLLANIPYTLYVTATSTAGLESERSTGIPYLLSLDTAPIIITQPKSVGSPLGLPVSLSVVATGGNLNFQWYRDGELLLGETNSTLSVVLSLLVQGSYHAVISNALGSVETSLASVSVAYPPQVISSPLGTNLNQGGTILLNSSASGTKPFTYQWFRNGQSIPAATNALLYITDAAANDSGSYHVRISNLAGSALSSTALVTVITPPRILTHPTGRHIVRGSVLQLSVTASSPVPISYQWFFNGTPIPSATNADFQVVSATDAHAGSYKVEVSNSAGVVTSSTAEIQVWPPLVILQQPIASTNILVGDELRLSVRAAGPQSISYQWFRGTVKLDGQTGPDLVLPNIGSADGGNYFVVVSSLAQSFISSPAQVTIVSEPTASDCSLALLRNTSGQLSVRAQAPPNATFDLQLTDSFSNPNWRRIATLTSDATGKMETTISVAGTGSGFVRAVRR